MLPRRLWAEMTTVDLSTSDTTSWMAVLPVAAIEQHGPHLPLLTDTAIAQAYIDRVLALAPADLPFSFLPVQAVGKSNEHIASPGTLTLSWETLTRVLIEIAESVARAGLRKLVLVNSHGGNVPILDIVAREMRVNHRMLCVATHWSRLGQPAALYADWELRYGIHGGDIETSIMRAARPDLVRMENAKKFHSLQEGLEQRHAHLRAHGPIAFGWQAQDLGPDGTVGDASLATVEKGHATIDHIAKGFIALLEDVRAFDMTQLYQG